MKRWLSRPCWLTSTPLTARTLKPFLNDLPKLFGLFLSCLRQQRQLTSAHQHSAEVLSFLFGAEGPQKAGPGLTNRSHHSHQWSPWALRSTSQRQIHIRRLTAFFVYLVLSSSSPTFHYLDLWPLTVSPTVQPPVVLPPSSHDLSRKGRISWSLVIYDQRRIAITGCVFSTVDGWFRSLAFTSSPNTAMTALNQVRLLFFNPWSSSSSSNTQLLPLPF